MTCSAQDCISPQCKGHRWTATSKSQANVEAFEHEVISYMQLTGRRDAGRCAAIVFASAQHKACVLA